MAKRNVVFIIGGAVAGSEAAAICAERGALAVVIDMGERPYGKIEDGLPRWHEKLRFKEYERVDKNLDRPGVHFLPGTRVGGDVRFDELEELAPSAIVLANGAWRDRKLPVDGVEDYVGRGLLYQNALVKWFNHQHEADYDGPRYAIPEGALVVGGGLASIDVLKICSLMTYARKLEARGVKVDLCELELRGIDAYCERHDIDPASLAVVPARLIYRRGMQDMALVDLPPDADEAMEKKVRAAREKIMRRVMRRHHVELLEHRMPVAPIVEDGHLAGLVLQRTEVDAEGKLRPVEGADLEVRSELVISSIGSVPAPIRGVPMRGELYDFDDQERGSLRGKVGVFGLGNVLTGRGNLKHSRQNARSVAFGLVEDYLGRIGEAASKLAIDHAVAAMHAAIHEQASATVEQALASGPQLEEAQVAKIEDWVKRRWDALGYTGYRSWIDAHTPDEERA